MNQDPIAERYQRTPLYEKHLALGAKMIPFAGFEMPAWYDSVIAEHQAVRRAAGLFDVSHMGEFFISGPGALAYLNRLVTNDLARLRDGRAQYNLLHTEEGGIVDDLIVYRLSEERWFVVVNAANVSKDFAWFKKHLPDNGVELTNQSERYSLLALQGPLAAEILALADPSLGEVAEMRPFRVVETEFRGLPATISTTGYTGERGFEIMVENQHAAEVFDRLLEAGAEKGLKPCGLGARDTLRLEVAYMLYGNDIDETTSAFEAGLDWVVKLEKDYFIGKNFLLRQKEEGITRKLSGLSLERRGPVPRHGSKVFDQRGSEVGYITSGSYSPTLDRVIALAYLPVELASPGNRVKVDVRGRSLQMTVVELPFYRPPR